ncbi:MAG: hypothetical protein AABZ74_05405 [Cyanobacteriota bacterium]
MKTGFKLYISSFLSILLVSCSGGNSATTPAMPNIANLAVKPSSSTETEIKRINLTGKVLDGITKKPIDNANILVYVISNDKLIESLKNGNKPEPIPSSSPLVSSGTSTATIPEIKPIPSIQPPSPKPIEENEEVSKPVTKPIVKGNQKPVAKTTIKPSIKPVAKPTIKPSVKPEPIKSLTPIEKPTATPKPKEELSPNDLKSVLSDIKINNIQEFESKTGNDGKYWVSKVPDSPNSVTILTVSADNYKSFSVFYLDNNKSEDIYLMPSNPNKYYSSVSASVLSLNNNPIENAFVSSSYTIGESFSVPTNSNLNGEFNFDDIEVGERIFVASKKNDSGKIISMGFLDTDIKKTDKSYKQKKSELEKKVEKIIEKDDTKITEIYDKKDEKLDSSDIKKIEEVKKDDKEIKEEPKKEFKLDKDKPNIKVGSVVDYINLKGKIDSKEMTLKNVNVYIVFKKKGLPKEEIFFDEKYFNKTSEDFELELPKLDSIYQYHLEFVGVNKKGFRSYHHEYGIKKDTKDIKFSFLEPISVGKFDIINKNDSKIPVFMWNAVEKTSFYKVSLDREDKNGNVNTIWEGITPFNSAVYPITTGANKITPAYSYSWSVSAIKDTDPIDKLSFAKLNTLFLNDVSNSSIMEFKLNSKDDDIEEIDKDKKKEG